MTIESLAEKIQFLSLSISAVAGYVAIALASSKYLGRRFDEQKRDTREITEDEALIYSDSSRNPYSGKN